MKETRVIRVKIRVSGKGHIPEGMEVESVPLSPDEAARLYRKLQECVMDTLMPKQEGGQS